MHKSSAALFFFSASSCKHTNIYVVENYNENTLNWYSYCWHS